MQKSTAGKFRDQSLHNNWARTAVRIAYFFFRRTWEAVNVAFWPRATEGNVRSHVGDRGMSGLVVLNVSFVADDPPQKYARLIGFNPGVFCQPFMLREFAFEEPRRRFGITRLCWSCPLVHTVETSRTGYGAGRNGGALGLIQFAVARA